MSQRHQESISPQRFKGGIHPHDGKSLSSGEAIRQAPLIDRYTLILQQNIGAPPKWIVGKGDVVKKGQKIAEAGGFVSVPLHSPVCGTIGAEIEIPGAASVSSPAIEIIPNGEDEWDSSLEPIPQWKDQEREKLRDRIRDAGIVGMGGAAFPTHVKLSPPPEKNIDTLLLNGAECEPYLTADHRLMVERADAVLEGAAIAAKILRVTRIFVGIEENKPDAIEAMSKIASKWGATIVPLHVRYPQGAEKQLIYALTGRAVAAGCLPMDVGCVVQNVGTCAAIREAVVLGHPLIERVATVTGSTVKHPGNWLVKIGTPISKVLAMAGGITEPPAKLILGGPMMGFAQFSLDVSVSKNTSGILLLKGSETAQYESGPCIRCGRCVSACPMGLLPAQLGVMAENCRFDDAEQWFVMDCMECGVCTYVCPAKRPLVQHFRRAKAEINAKRRKK